MMEKVYIDKAAAVEAAIDIGGIVQTYMILNEDGTPRLDAGEPIYVYMVRKEKTNAIK